MRTTRQFKTISAVATVFLALTFAVPSAAHHGADAVLAPVAAPTPAAPVESVAGTLDELIVDNKLTNISSRYVALQQANGDSVALAGAALDAFAKGTQLEASGRRNGSTLFVTAARAISAPRNATIAVTKSQPSPQGETMQVQGTLLLAHADEFATGHSEYMLNVQAADGTTTSLKVPVLPDSLQVGMSVIALGSMAEDGFSLAASRIVITALAAPKTDDTKRITGKDASANNVLVLMIKFSDSPNAGDDTKPFTQGAVQQVMSTNANSVAAYYNEVSYGQHLLNVTVTGWLHASVTKPTGCDYNGIATAANATASSAGYNVGTNPPGTGGYQNVFYVFESDSSCGWAGLAYIGYGRAWSDGYNLLPVFAHELGHNFGLLHAASLRCSSTALTTGSSGCTSSEYGDPFSVMGDQGSSSIAMHFNAKQKSVLNWIPSSSVATYASGTSTYTLTPLEASGGATYAVKIPASGSRTYWLEYRQPIGQFDGAFSYPNNGAQVRIANPFESLCSGCADDSELLDMTPSTTSADFHDAALIVGQNYTDAAAGFTVSVLSASPTALTVQVSNGSPPPTPTATTTTVASATNPATPGASVTFTATVTGTAPAGSVNFTDGGTSISGCSASALSGTGNSRTATCTTTTLSVATHSIVASYGGNSGNAASTSSALSQVVSGSTNNVQFLVDHYYQAILGRAPDVGGEAYWESEAVRMQGMGVDVKEAYMVMAGYFFNSSEYLTRNTSDAQYVTDLYNTFFNRAPDSGGLAYWTGQIASGLPRSIVMYGFMFSPEFNAFMTSLFGDTSSRAEVYAVVDFYRGILNRLPDTAGFNSALTQLRTAQCAGSGQVYAAVDQISSYFIYSSEYASRNRSNTDYVGDLYYAFLRRGGDLAGVSYWLNQLASGAEGREQLHKDFINTPEFSARVNAIISQGCLS